MKYFFSTFRIPLTAYNGTAAFTLIELSLVIVIIGLLVGGVLVGRDIISAAGVRATITQIEGFQRATNVFREKYGYLPGDIPNPDATRFGFLSRGPYEGEGDGNFLLEGATAYAPASNDGQAEGFGENVMFWRDLRTAKLIEGQFNVAQPATFAPAATITLATTPSLRDFFPEARIGQGNFIYIYSANSTNYIGLSRATAINFFWQMPTSVGLTVKQAYSIDAKIDDGQPTLGNVAANYMSNGGTVYSPYAASDSTTTCYNTTAPYSYSLSAVANYGAGRNCGIHFTLK